MKHFLKILLPITVGVLVFFHVITTNNLYAAAPGVRFTPTSGTYTTGNNFAVDVYGTAAGGGWYAGVLQTKVTVTYPTSLSYVGANNTGSVISGGVISHNPTARTITFAASQSVFGIRSPVDGKLFSVTFRAANAGSSTLDFSDSNVRGENVPKTPATYSVINPSCPAGQVGTPPNCTTPPPATCPAGQIGTPPNCTTPATPAPVPTPTPVPKPTTSTPKTTPTPTTSAPNTSVPVADEKKETAATALSLKDVSTLASYDTARVQWSVTAASTNTFTYGTNSSKLDNKATVTPGADPLSFESKLSKLKLGTRYFYAVTATQSDGKVATQKGSFTTKAYPVIVRITHDESPLSHAKISLQGYEESYTTNDKGELSLNLTSGDYKALIAKDAISEEQSFTVKELAFKSGGIPDTQIVTITISAASAPSGTNPLPVIILATILLFLVVGGILAGIFWRKHRSGQAALGAQSYTEDPLATQNDETPLGADDSQAMYQPPAYAYPTDQQVYPAVQQYYPEESASLVEPAYPDLAATDTFTESEQPVSNSLELEAPGEDIWSVPATYAPQPPEYTNDPPETALHEASPLSVEPTASPQILSQESTPDIAAQQEVATPLQAAVAPQAPYESSEASPTPESTQEEVYEYNEDNSMTIHHAS